MALALYGDNPKRVGHEHETEEDEEENGHGVAHPLLFIAEHEGKACMMKMAKNVSLTHR